MTIQNGTVWNKYINANYEEVTVDSQRSMLRAFDFLTGTIKVLDTALTTPPITPANGDAYCVLTGAVAPWTDNTFQVWRTGVTSGITNDPVAPFWESYSLAEGITFFSANDATHYQVNAGLTISTFGGGNPFDQDLNTFDEVQFQFTTIKKTGVAGDLQLYMSAINGASIYSANPEMAIFGGTTSFLLNQDINGNFINGYTELHCAINSNIQRRFVFDKHSLENLYSVNFNTSGFETVIYSGNVSTSIAIENYIGVGVAPIGSIFLANGILFSKKSNGTPATDWVKIAQWGTTPTFNNLELSGGVVTNPTVDGDILLQVDDAGTARLKTTSPSGRIALTLENNDAVFAGFSETFMAYRSSKITLASAGIVIDGDGSAPVTIKSSGVNKILVGDDITTITNDLRISTGVMNAPTGLEIQAYGVQVFTVSGSGNDLNLWRKSTSEAVLVASDTETSLYALNSLRVFQATASKTEMSFGASNYISIDGTGTLVKGNFVNEVGADARIITNNVGVTLYGGAGAKQIEVNQNGAYVTGGMNIENGNDGNVTSGVYTPTITGLTNFTSGTAFPTTFLRVGNSIHIGGRIDVVPTGAGLVQFYISLPVNCTISDGSQASGVATNLSTAYYPFTLLGLNQPNGAILFEGAVLGGGNQVFFFNAIYRLAI